MMMDDFSGDRCLKFVCCYELVVLKSLVFVCDIFSACLIHKDNKVYSWIIILILTPLSIAHCPLACSEPSKAQPTNPVTPCDPHISKNFTHSRNRTVTHHGKEYKETTKSHSSHHSKSMKYLPRFPVPCLFQPNLTQPPHLCIGQLTELLSGNSLCWLHCCQAEDDAKSSTEAQQRSSPGEAFWGTMMCQWWEFLTKDDGEEYC